ncbi:methyltransferase domain-containing protein [Actinomadura hibisca]|uniref:methyltransferase domain-containing protein n=1 Tax=Actinomadura hibisca TaxID=68565 RepID=UPI000831C985|nr:methyltransferase domain-containing protein [Actinomadura hibisca]
MDSERLNQAMISEIEKLGDLGPWKGALRAVPRHLFIPSPAYVSPDDRPGYVIDREADPETWLRACYADEAIITQIDDGAFPITEAVREGARFTSSASAPSTVVAFLSLLGTREGHNVLEIGTGTGWTAALLSAVVGEPAVTTVEVDPQVSQRASRNLHAAGHAPRLITADGTNGFPDGAPYDRIHVTCGINDVPPAWIEQTRPGGIIVAPYRGELASIVVREGGELRVRTYGRARFMMLRSQRA